METQIIEQNQLTETEISRRKAIVFFKGYVVGYAVRHGFKWESKHEPTHIFEAGMKASKNCYADINLAHVIYNRLRRPLSIDTTREYRSHLGSEENDTCYLKNKCYCKWESLMSSTLKATVYNIEGIV